MVWNVTRRCNLKCVHCYSHSEDKSYSGELSFEEGKALIDDLRVRFRRDFVLGGRAPDPQDILNLIRYATEKGRRAVVSTNGTLITLPVAENLKEIGLSYVGISLDGLEPVHGRVSGLSGTFARAMEESGTASA